jgi:S-(hydroxymethyl)glutathione dehydrogenase/alcohol dehydrogenase
MKTPAAILVETGQPLVIDDLEVPRLRPGQVLAEVCYSGVCHTQLLECRGYRGPDRFLPHCLGHEGSGIVCEVGPGITKVKPGDRVILSWIRGSGEEVAGSTYGWRGRTVNAGAITTFGRHSVVSENRLTVLPDWFPLREAALLGCALPTGLGAVLHTGEAKPGTSAVVFGTGGVGLAAVAGCVLAGCATIVAVDVVPQRLERARRIGATHTVHAASTDTVAEVLRLCPGGADLAIEASGRPAVMEQALLSVRSQGGIAVIVGNARAGEKLTLDPRQLNQGKQLRGTWGGDNQPDRDYPRYCELLRSGKLDLTPLMAEPVPLERVNDALLELEHGLVGRPLLKLAA